MFIDYLYGVGKTENGYDNIQLLTVEYSKILYSLSNRHLTYYESSNVFLYTSASSCGQFAT